ncbi:MAG TPA: hypothetical protein ENG40_04260 [Thermoprotei archaeon]|nr:hypothetical protein [Thermoprotei archaeon]
MKFWSKIYEFFMGKKKEDQFEKDLKEVKKLSKVKPLKKSDISFIEEFRDEVEMERLKKRSLRSLVEEE